MGGLNGGPSSIGGSLRRCASARIKAESSDSDLEQQGLRCSVTEQVPHGRKRRVALVGFLLVVSLLAGHAIHDGHNGRGNPFVWLFGRVSLSVILYFHPYYQGRMERLDPSPRCCYGADCVAKDGGKHAVVTMIRTDQYLGLTQGLACSLNRTNPGLPFVVITVKGDLQPESEDAIRLVARLIHVDEFFIENLHTFRFSYNWIKLRAWQLTEYDAILMLDSDVTVAHDIEYLFKLPTDFATVLDVDKLRSFSRFSPLGSAQGGVQLLRPCAAVGVHMMKLIDDDYMLKFPFHDAEQHFLDWYFKYTRWTMPQEYNALNGRPHMVTLPNNPHGRNVTIGGALPVIKHYTGKVKPWRANLEECQRAVAAQDSRRLGEDSN